MDRVWSKPIGVTGSDAADYWDYFGARLVEHAAISAGMRILDVGCGTGSSLLHAARKVSPAGRVVGIDICPH